MNIQRIQVSFFLLPGPPFAAAVSDGYRFGDFWTCIRVLRSYEQMSNKLMRVGGEESHRKREGGEGVRGGVELGVREDVVLSELISVVSWLSLLFIVRRR